MIGNRGLGPRLLFVVANASIDRLLELDALSIGSINRPAMVTALPGGKGLNAARAATFLGASATAIAILSGRAGDWIEEQAALEGIVVRRVTSNGETRTCTSVLDRSTDELTEFYEAGPPIPSETWTALEAAVVEEMGAGDADAVVLSGSLPPGAPVDGYGRLVRLAHSFDVPAFVDASGSALAAALEAHPSVVKVNAHEAATTSGLAVRTPQDAARAAAWLRDQGAGLALVTLGTEGAVAVGDGAAWRFEPPNERGRYPVGSGDALIAGLAVGRSDRSRSFVDAILLGLAAATANALIPGAGRLDPMVLDELERRQRWTQTTVEGS